MRFDEFQRLGYALTEKEIRKYEREIIANYTAAYREISTNMQAQYLKILSGVKPEDYYNEMLKYNRLEIMLGNIQADYYKFAKSSGNLTIKALRTAFINNYNRQQFTTSWGAVDAKYTALPESLIELATVGSDKSFKAVTAAVADKFGSKPLYMPQVGSLSALIADNAKKEVEAIRRDIITGLRNGQGYKKTARSVRDTIGYFYKQNGTDKIKGAMASAVRIVRTESTRVLNAASFANGMQLESQGVEAYKRWMATLDDRTRDRHQALDGKEAPLDVAFMSNGYYAQYPGEFGVASEDCNCRCTTCTIVPGLEPDIRMGRNPVTGANEVFSYKDYDKWMEGNS